MTDRFICELAASEEDIKACHDIRIQVFVDEQGYNLDDEVDDIDDKGLCTHWLVRDTQSSNKPVGCVRLVPSLGKLTRLAVLEPYRSFGLGRVLVRALEVYVVEHPEEMKYVREEGGRTFIKIKIHSQIPVIKFYGKMGYTAVGDVFDEEGEPHILMEREIEVPA